MFGILMYNHLSGLVSTLWAFNGTSLMEPLGPVSSQTSRIQAHGLRIRQAQDLDSF